MNGITRRRWMRAGIAGAAGLSGVAVAARIADRYGLIPPDSGGIYGPGETLTYAAHRLLSGDALAREFSRSQISPRPFANGKPPKTEEFLKLQSAGFSGWNLSIEGMVAHPVTLSLAELKSLPQSHQITHLACEEGWSFIAEWTGVQLSYVLQKAGILPQARYMIYHSIQENWTDSIDIADAMHPQTFITYAMNGTDLPVPHGGPLRLRVPRQLGYKSVKYLTRLVATDRLKPESPSYSWYAGI